MPRARNILVSIVLASTAVFAQEFTPAPGAELIHRPLDQILDVNVRDGLVYYRALKSDRGRLDRYIASLNVTPATYQGWSKSQQMAFWVNAYNAFVLETVINHYPLRGTIRQIPGAFDKTTWRAAGKTLTLDQIEKTILPEFRDPRLYLALGRGAVGGGRLRSEAYTGDRLEKQLSEVRTDFVNNRHLYKLDRMTNTLSVTPIISWRQNDFIDAYVGSSEVPGQQANQRSPIERAIVAFVWPSLLPSERELVQKNEYKVAFLEMDWRLNDLTGGRVE